MKRWWVKCKFSTRSIPSILRSVSKFLYRIPGSFFVGPRTVAKHECYADLNVLKNLTYQYSLYKRQMYVVANSGNAFHLDWALWPKFGGDFPCKNLELCRTSLRCGSGAEICFLYVCIFQVVAGMFSSPKYCFKFHSLHDFWRGVNYSENLRTLHQKSKKIFGKIQKSY